VTAVLPNCVVEASAGTGKTTSLVNRIIDLVLAGASVERIVAVTFTNAAAGDMKVRLREQLDRKLSAGAVPGDQRARLVSALHNLEKAFIGTIHSFCASILRQRPVEARLDPQFQELAEMESSRLFSGVFRSWLEERLASGSTTLNRAMCLLAYMEDRGEDPALRLRDEAWRLAEWRDMDAPWCRRHFDRKAEIDSLLDRLCEIAKGWRINLDRAPKGLREAAALVRRARVGRESGCPQYDDYEAALASIGQKEADVEDFRFESSSALLDADFESWRALREAACRFREASQADLAADLRDELWQVVQRYQGAKVRAGQVDFTDLLVATRDLLQHDGVRTALQSRFDHILVDEFQDTDPVQAEVLLLLASEDPHERDWRQARPARGKLFIVGDPKQSIYRFRRADVDLYRKVCRQLEASGAEQGKLQNSRRSVRPIQTFVNAAFQNRMSDYLPLIEGREAIGSQPAVVALPVPPTAGKRGRPAKYLVERHAPALIAGFVEWLLQSGWQVVEKGSRVPVAPRHICILFRRFKANTTGDYVRAFERRNIQHLLAGSKSLHGREEAGVIRTALAAVEWPRDEFSVYATLRGPLFAVTDRILARYRSLYSRLNPLRIPEDAAAEFDGVRYALELLGRLHRGRNFEPLPVTISRLLAGTRAHANFAFRPGGGRVLGNVNRLVDLARRFDATTATSFRSFVEFLEGEALAGEAFEAPLLEHDGEGVRLMTVHKAKGLEFPVVILADPTCNLVGSDAGSRYVDHNRRLCAQTLLRCAPWDVLEHSETEKQVEIDEAWRVAYVGATRARDLLVITTAGAGLGEGWLSPLEPALQSEKDTHWFDTSLLTPEPAMFDGLEKATRSILQGDPGPGLERYEQWRVHRAAVLAAGRSKSISVQAATSAALPEGLEEIPVQVLKIRSGMSGPSNRRLGKLVHAILQDIDFQRRDRLERVADAHARRLGVERDSVEAAVNAVRQVLVHPLFASADSVCRELPFVLRAEDGALLEGSVDFAVRNPDGWTLFDFKVGQAGTARHDRQMQIYSEALRRASGLPVQAYLVEIS
jgi:ATP-dependent exoDNAse (exonuclease V) beta subunit